MRYLFLLLLIPALLLLYIRFAPMVPARWHTDPATAERPGSPNAYLMRNADGDSPAIVVAAPLRDVAQALDQVLASAPRVTRLAGRAEDGLVTYVQRSRIFAFPDAISLRLTAVEGGTQVEVFSRSRFGYSDGCVNAARVTRWMNRLQATLTP